MAQYTIAQLEALSQLAGQGERDATSQHASDAETLHPPPARSDIRQQVYWLLIARGDWMSRAEVAKALGLKKTGWLNATLDKLATDGYLERVVVHGNSVLPKFYYLARRTPNDSPRGY